MNIQYQLDISISSLTFKKPLKEEGLFRITLIQASKEIDPSSDLFQTQQNKLPRGQKTVQLTTVKSFKFRANNNVPPGSYILKFQIRGIEDGSPQNIPLGIARMLNEFKKKNKSVFEQSFEGRNQIIQYKVVISLCDEKSIEEAASLQIQAVNAEQENKCKSKASSSANQNTSKGGRNRMSRPPELSISKKTEQKARAFSLSPSVRINEENNELNTPVLTPIITSKESLDELQSPQTLRKKISSLPLSEIQKVNELMATHHRIEQHVEERESLSYKLKIVFFMVVLGIVFLLYDTIGDRSKRRVEISKIQRKKQHKNKERQGRRKLVS